MIICESWLREWVNPQCSTEELVAALTMAGLEVDGVSPVARRFSGIVVGQVESVEPHPGADKLSLCTVNDGNASWQVVCGAPNVEAGMKAPFAKVGVEIHTPDSAKPFKIKVAKLRGVESSGMLCSAEELGLAEHSDGLLALAADAPVGADIRDWLALDDSAIELDLTPNRGDCLSVQGVAREVGVLTRSTVSVPAIAPAPVSHDREFPIAITAGDECPRYLGRIIRNINQAVETPPWMQEKLRRSGLRSIDPVVDVTNFVLLELGQPMHAFDFTKLQGGIEVRLASPNEKITLLDGREVEMTGDTLVIADAEKPVAMAGVMGGESTAVSEQTSDVFLECAFFSPLAIAGKARSYGMHTDASHRYERGVDHGLQHRAMERATLLLLDIVGGEAGPVTEALGNLPKARQVTLRHESIARSLGVSMAKAEVVEILERLGFAVEGQGTDGQDADGKGTNGQNTDRQGTNGQNRIGQGADRWLIDVPSFRFDISIEADLIEELARIYGYDNIPLGGGLSPLAFSQADESRVALSRLRDHLVALGYQEIISYSFIDPALSELVSDTGAQTIALQNPIAEDMGVMRSSLLPGLLQTLKYNSNRQQDRLRLFESGLAFEQCGGTISQQARIAGVISGARQPKNWNNDAGMADFYDVKGDIEILAGMGGKGTQCSFRPAQKKPFHPGQCAELLTDAGEVLGTLGTLHPAIQRELELQHPVCLFELDLEMLQRAVIPRAATLSRYPEVTRDIAIVINEAVPAAEISRVVIDNGGECLRDVRIFDVYQGDAVEKGKRSVALGLTWQHPSRTLDDEEINTIIGSCINALQEQFNANLRN